MLNPYQLKKKWRLKFFSSWGKVFWILFGSVTLFFFSALLVVLSITKSDVLVSVPMVKYQYLTDIFNTIMEKGLKLKVDLVDIPELNKGYILSQTPAPGVMVRTGHKIKLRVSRGIRFCQAPNLIGIPKRAVPSLLNSVHVGERSAELKIGQVALVPSEKERFGIVLDQLPKPNERIQIGSAIHLLISKGNVKHNFQMANYKNQDIDLLYKIFAVRNITVMYKIKYIKDKQKHGRVLAQYPYRGARLRKGSSVTFTIGIFKEELFHRVGYEVVRYRVGRASAGKILTVFIVDNYPKRSRFQKKVKTGQIILAVLRREGNAKITIESDGKVLKTIKITEYSERK